MVYEVEVKSRAPDLDAVKQRLEELGATFKNSHLEVDTYYRNPSRDFAETDEALRVREVNGKHILTYKGPKIDLLTKAREEHEVEVRSGDVGDMTFPGGIDIILEKLGFTPVRIVEKKRDSYLLDGVTVCLDNVKGLGGYVEAELFGSEVEMIASEIELARNRVLDMMKKLGLSEFERRSYLELLLEKDE